MAWCDLTIRAVLFSSLQCLIPLAWADVGLLQVLVQDFHKRPVKGIEIGIEGSGGSLLSMFCLFCAYFLVQYVYDVMSS
jgi:hypothetical protein